MNSIAHTKPDSSATSGWQDHALDEHLLGVAALAERFASDFEGAAYAELAGRYLTNPLFRGWRTCKLRELLTRTLCNSTANRWKWENLCKPRRV